MKAKIQSILSATTLVGLVMRRVHAWGPRETGIRQYRTPTQNIYTRDRQHNNLKYNKEGEKAKMKRKKSETDKGIRPPDNARESAGIKLVQ